MLRLQVAFRVENGPRGSDLPLGNPGRTHIRGLTSDSEELARIPWSLVCSTRGTVPKSPAHAQALLDERAAQTAVAALRKTGTTVLELCLLVSALAGALR